MRSNPSLNLTAYGRKLAPTLGIMKAFITVIAVAQTMLLSACDPAYSVRRYAELPALPDLSCIEAVVQSAPGVKHVEYEAPLGARPLTWSGVQEASQIHSFFYRGEDREIWGQIQVTKDHKGAVSFVQNQTTVNDRPPNPAAVLVSRKIMRSIEIALAEKCGLSQLPASIKERCLRLNCPPLSGADAQQSNPPDLRQATLAFVR